MTLKLRGFRKDGKGWVGGYVSRDNLGGYMITSYSDDFYFSSCHLIDKESLSMFTGLTDKHGKEIFGSIPINGVMTKGGDVLAVGGGIFIGNVRFKDGSFIIENNKMERFRYLHSIVSEMGYEIIGNQYESNG